MNTRIELDLSLADYGWSHIFELAHTDPAFDDTMPVRVMAVHRDAYDVAGPDFSGRIQGMSIRAQEEARPTVGDWVAIDPQSKRIMALYPRKSLFKRRNVGKANRVQLIAANVDTVFIVTSANNDFNIARLERYLALAHEAEVFPVLVITKADLVEDIAPYLDQALALRHDLVIEAVNARSSEGLQALQPWLTKGQTVALMGSSGVGKSTIINSLLEREEQDTQGIREDDSRGRHTTSGRSLHRMNTGAWLIDTPGMREIQIVDTADGIDTVFDDITGLAASCRFSNCNHNGEPGCAVEAAIKSGSLDADRLARFQKLQSEERHNTQSLYEAHQRSRAFGKMVKTAMKEKAKRQEDW
ncbi:MAG: ribosome small subunit-dependent GTPase A [Rhizobiaceae bacterium]